MSEYDTAEEIAIRPRGSMHFAFELSMPNNNAWDGKWSGEGRSYVRVKSFSQKEWKTTAAKLVGGHYFNFGDGWGASVSVRVVDADTKKKLVKQSAGFCGYDWMIDSLILHGVIRR
jgi:hypothetical protein